MLDSSEAALRSAITRALRQPDVNLNEITAKDVRSLLVEAGDLSAEEAKEKRKEIKELVGVVFWELKDGTGEGEAVDDDGVDREGAGTEVEDGGGEREGDYEEEEQLKPKKKQKKSGKSSALTDEEYARKLSDELNAGGARATRGGGGKKVTAKGAKTKKKSVKKSADLVDSDGEDGDGVTTKKRKAGGGFMKEYNLRYGQLFEFSGLGLITPLTS
jgi:hypothetical protein